MCVNQLVAKIVEGLTRDMNFQKKVEGELGNPSNVFPIITLDVLWELFRGKTSLFSGNLLYRFPENSTGMLRFIQEVYGGTILSPFKGTTPLLPDNLSDGKNKLTILRRGRYVIYEQFQESIKRDQGGLETWKTLRSIFTANRRKCLDQISERISVIFSCLDDSAINATHQVFCYVNGCEEKTEREEQQKIGTPDDVLCRRQLTLLFIEALIDLEAATEACLGWVRTGELSSRSAVIPSDSDSLKQFFGEGIFALKKEEIQDELLPDIKVLKDNQRKSIKYSVKTDKTAATPLEQVLQDNQEHHVILLCGDERSSVSGTGKTTSLRRLYYSIEALAPLFIPLNRIYTPYALRNTGREYGSSRLLTWLSKQNYKFQSIEDLGKRIILLDGLDEVVTPEGVQALCDDLVSLQENGKLILLISSKMEPEKLPSWGIGLQNISSTWDSCLRCYVQPMRDEQKRLFLGSSGESLQELLTSPFLLKLYKNVQDFLSKGVTARNSAPLRRWFSKSQLETRITNPEQLFYRYLVVQMCRWFDNNLSGDAQNERDAFFLMFALPAVAFQMFISEIYDSTYVSSIPSVDTTFIKKLLNNVYPAFCLSLQHFPAYQKGGLAVLAGNRTTPGEIDFSIGQASSVLYQTLNLNTMEWEYQFNNYAIRDNLAALHLANLFFMAYYRKINESPEFLSLYNCPVYFLPRPTLICVTNYLDELFGEKNYTIKIIMEGPKDLDDPHVLSLYLLCCIARDLCDVLYKEKRSDWEMAAAQTYQRLRKKLPVSAGQYNMNHIQNLCGLAQSMRQKGNIIQAVRWAKEAIAFQRECADLKNSDGYNYLAKAYLEQITYILNQSKAAAFRDEELVLEISQENVTFSNLVYRDLLRITKLLDNGQPVGCDTVFGAIPKENLSIIQPVLQILLKAHIRLRHYEHEQFFDSKVVEFLLKGSYIAKAHSIYAAISAGSSGVALNMLACFLENQQEELENHKELPFFQKNPCLHCEISSELLEYTDNHVNAFLVYLRIYRIRRGLQPYSARKVAQSLICRRVRLDSSGMPIAGPGGDPDFTEKEWRFLDEATKHACVGLGSGYRLPRIRFLNEYIQMLDSTGSRDPLKMQLLQEASKLFKAEWEENNCSMKLKSASKEALDFNTIVLVAECRPEFYNPVQINMNSCEARILDFYHKELKTIYWKKKGIESYLKKNHIQTPGAYKDHLEIKRRRKFYTTGTRMQILYLQETWRRLQCLGEKYPVFRELSEKGNNRTKCGTIITALEID